MGSIYVIAAAFEVSVLDVAADALALQRRVRSGCADAKVVVERWLKHRDHWDDTVTPYYLAHLHGLIWG